MSLRQSAIRIKMKAWSPATRDLWEERAAIMEYDGGLTRETAEWKALQDVVAVLGRSDRTC